MNQQAARSTQPLLHHCVSAQHPAVSAQGHHHMQKLVCREERGGGLGLEVSTRSSGNPSAPLSPRSSSILTIYSVACTAARVTKRQRQIVNPTNPAPPPLRSLSAPDPQDTPHARITGGQIPRDNTKRSWAAAVPHPGLPVHYRLLLWRLHVLRLVRRWGLAYSPPSIS